MAKTTITDSKTAVELAAKMYNARLEELDLANDPDRRNLAKDAKLIKYPETGIRIAQEAVTAYGDRLIIDIQADMDCKIDEITDELYNDIKRCFRYYGHLLNLNCMFIIDVNFVSNKGDNDTATIEIDMR